MGDGGQKQIEKRKESGRGFRKKKSCRKLVFKGNRREFLGRPSRREDVN